MVLTVTSKLVLTCTIGGVPVYCSTHKTFSINDYRRTRSLWSCKKPLPRIIPSATFPYHPFLISCPQLPLLLCPHLCHYLLINFLFPHSLHHFSPSISNPTPPPSLCPHIHAPHFTLKPIRYPDLLAFSFFSPLLFHPFLIPHSSPLRLVLSTPHLPPPPASTQPPTPVITLLLCPQFIL